MGSVEKDRRKMPDKSGAHGTTSWASVVSGASRVAKPRSGFRWTQGALRVACYWLRGPPASPDSGEDVAPGCGASGVSGDRRRSLPFACKTCYS